MRWHFGGSNLQPVRMVCEYDWKECPLAIANYIWCEIVTDVLESLTNEVLIWRILLVAVLCWMVLRTAYTKTLWIKKKEQDFSKEHMIKVGFKMQDLELKINILTYKMQYGIWPLPHEIPSPSLNDLQHVKLSLSDTGGQNFWAHRRLRGYVSKRFGNLNNKDPLSVNKHVSMSEHTELVERSDSLTRLRNGSENITEKNLKNYEKLVRTADECRKYMKEISTSNKSLGLFEESSEMSDWNSIKNRLGSESEQNDGTFRLDPTKWYEIYKCKNKIAEKSQTHDVNVANRLTSLGKSNQTEPRWLQTKLSIPIKNKEQQPENLSKIEKKEKTLPPGLSITFLTDHSKKSSKEKTTTTDSLKHALKSNNSTCETLDKVKEKLEKLDRTNYTSNDNKQCRSAYKSKEKRTKKQKLNTKQSSSAEFGLDNNIRDKAADSSIPIHRQKRKEFRMHEPDENEFMFYLPSYNNNSAVSHKSFHESSHLPLKTATKTQTSLSTHSSCENALNVDFNERDMDNGDKKNNDKRKQTFAVRREPVKHKTRGLSKIRREDSSPERGSQTLLQLKPTRTQNSGEDVESPSEVGSNVKSMLNLSKHTENIDNDYKRRENNINLYEMNRSRNSPTHEKRARREQSYSPTPMETEDDVPILSETSSRTEWSRNSDTDDRSTMKLLREALELKKALLMRVNNESQASPSKHTRNESSECESDDATSKLDNHFQSKVLDIISEEQSISSSTEKTSKTYLRSKGIETAKISDTAQKSVMYRENKEKENCNKIKGFHVDSKSFTIISAKYSQRYDTIDPQTSGWSQQELTGKDGKSLVLRNEMKHEDSKRINGENSNRSQDASTNKCEEIEQKQKSRMVSDVKAENAELELEKGTTRQQKCNKMENIDSVNLDDRVSWDTVNKTPSKGRFEKITGLVTNSEYIDVDAATQQKLGSLSAMDHDKLKFTVVEETSSSILKIDNRLNTASGSNSDMYKCSNYAESNILDTNADCAATICEPKNKSSTCEYHERTNSFQARNVSKHERKELQGKQDVTGTSQCSETTPMKVVDSNLEKQANEEDTSPLTGRTVISISNSKEQSGTVDTEICNTSEHEDRFDSMRKLISEKSNIDEMNINHIARKPRDHDVYKVIADNNSDDNENHTIEWDPTMISRQDYNEDKPKLPKEDNVSNKNERIQSTVTTEASSIYLTDNASDWNVELTAAVNEIPRYASTTDKNRPDIIPGRFSSLPLVTAGNREGELFSNNSNQITRSGTSQSTLNSINNENPNYGSVYNENIPTKQNNTQLCPDNSKTEELETHLNNNQLSGTEVSGSEFYFDLSNHEFTVSSVILTSENSNSASNNDKIVENEKNSIATIEGPDISNRPSNESENLDPIDNEKAMQMSINNIPSTSMSKEPLMVQKSPRNKLPDYLLKNATIHDEDRVMATDDWTERETTNNNSCSDHKSSTKIRQSPRSGSSISSNNRDTRINVSEQESATKSSSNLEQSSLKANLMFKNDISAQSYDSLTQEGSGSCLNLENYSMSSISIPKLKVMSRSSSKSGIPVLKTRVDTPKTEKVVERINKGRSRSPLRRPNTIGSQGLESNNQMGGISCTPRTEQQLRLPYRRRRSVDAVQSENTSLIDLSSNIETKLEMKDQTGDNEKCRIVESVSNELRSTSEKCNLLDPSGLLTKDCTVIYINIITDNDKNSANSGNSNGQLKQIQYKDMIICNKDTKAKSHELLLKSLKADGLNYVINPINLTSDNKICIDISDHLNPKPEKCPTLAVGSTDLEMTDLNVVKNLNEPQPTINLVADKMLSTQSFDVKQKEMEVLAKPSIKDTSTSVSDFPNDPPNENSLFHDPTNVMISSRRLTQKERILWAEMLINSDSNLMECKKTHKLYNKLGLCFQDQLDHL